MISAMCEGLLRLTVDRIFRAPPPPASNLVDVDDRSFDSNAGTPTHASGAGSCVKSQGRRTGHFGTWRPIAKAPPSGSRAQKTQPETTPSPSDAHGAARNPSAQVFSLTGRRLTRRSLARAERGVREATAVRALAAWWRSIADECREARSRKLRAAARISAWATKSAARRRQEALFRSRAERSARVIQARWRRATEARRLVARTAACFAVQAAWRQRQHNRRRASRRVRRRVFSGLQRWATATLFRRQSTARKTILRAVTAAMTRHARSRRLAAAADIMRELKTACNRRRQSRLRLQRFARLPCLLRVRLAALSLARLDRVQNGAAKTIARAFRRAALARSAAVRAALAARTLQSWYRTLLSRWTKRYTSIVTIQQAWRQRRVTRRSLLAEAGQPPPKGPAKTAVATEILTATNVPECAVGPGKMVGADGAAALDTPGSKDVGQVSPDRQAAGSGAPQAGHSSHASDGSPPDRSVGEKDTHIQLHRLRVPVNGQDNQLVSPATTARENWSDPDLCLADGGAQSCRSLVSRDGSLSYNETCCATAVVYARGPSSLSGRSTPRPGKREGGKATSSSTDDGSFGGILDFQDVLPDILKRRQRDTGSKQQQRMQAKGGSRRLGDGRVTPASGSLGERLPYPPAGGTQPIDTLAHHWITRRPARTNGREGRRGVACMKPAPETLNERIRRGEAAVGSSHCRPRPRTPGCRRTAPKGNDHNFSLGWNGTRAKDFSCGRIGAQSGGSRVDPASSRARAKRSAKRRAGARGARESSSLGGGIRWKGESGGILEMLAFMDAA